MISTAFLTDYNKRLYSRGSAHNHLKLFCSLIPGSEIVTAEYESEPTDFESHWFNYRYLQDNKQFIHDLADSDFAMLSNKTVQFLKLWSHVISKLNFVYQRDSNPFLWNTQNDDLNKLLSDVANRCEMIIINNFKINDYNQARYDIERETYLNIFL
jgi:hypothetical protein